MEVIEHPWGDIFVDEGLVIYEKAKDVKNGITWVTEEEYAKFVREKMMAVGLLLRVNTKRYRELIKSIRDKIVFDIDIYPNVLHYSLQFVCMSSILIP